MRVAQCGGSKTVVTQHYKDERERAAQYKEAMEWCQANGKGGWAAANLMIDGQRKWPLINRTYTGGFS